MICHGMPDQWNQSSIGTAAPSIFDENVQKECRSLFEWNVPVKFALRSVSLMKPSSRLDIRAPRVLAVAVQFAQCRVDKYIGTAICSID